jgi:heat shock factor-binding protein 1
VHWRFCLFACNDKFSFSVIKFGQDSRHGQGQGHDGGDSAQSTADLTAFVQNLLQQMQSRFQTMSDSIISKIDEMGSRIDDLEKSIGELVKEAGVDSPPSPPTSSQGQLPPK